MLVDTGFLIAQFKRTDTLHESAKRMLVALVRDRPTTLVSVWLPAESSQNPAT